MRPRRLSGLGLFGVFRRLLFEGQYTVGPLSVASYDVTPDGRHFVMLQSSDASPGATQIHVVQNWQAGLKK